VPENTMFEEANFLVERFSGSLLAVLGDSYSSA
jgi:hypothetical protein